MIFKVVLESNIRLFFQTFFAGLLDVNRSSYVFSSAWLRLFVPFAHIENATLGGAGAIALVCS